MSERRKLRNLLLLALAPAALAACETVREEVNEVVGDNFRADLNGANEVPGPGDPDGWGRATMAFNDATNTICTDLEVRDIGTVTAAHIHRGRAGESGPPVVPLDPPDDNDSNDCDVVGDALLDEINRNPAGFYVNVHTAEYPQGAIRGQIVDVNKE